MGTESIIRLENLEDPRLELYADIRHRAAISHSPYFIAEGRLVVERLIRSTYDVHSLLVESGVEAEFAERAPPGVPVYSLSKSQIRQLVGFDFHRGVIACGHRKPIAPFSDFVPRGEGPTVTLAALGVSEPANLGVILRTAAAFGIDQVLLGPGTHDPLARRVIRTSMAATFKHHFYRLDDPAGQLRTLSQRLGCQTMATTLATNADPIEAFTPRSENLVLVLGSESRGLDPEVEQAATDRVKIPMRLGIDSLNVSTAAAIFLYELTRNRPATGHSAPFET